MTAAAVATAVAAGACVSLLIPSRAAERRVRALLVPQLRPTAARQRARTPDIVRPLAVLLLTVAVAMFVGGVTGLLAGVVTSGVVLRALARLEPTARRQRRQAIERDLPVALDLLGACLTAGVSVPDATRAVATELGGPLGAEFAAVTAALDLGVAPAEAWLALPSSGFGAIGRTFARATSSGAPLAEVAVALADERRAAVHTQGAAAARRAGVAVVGPLGLCFLPAFLCTAVVPVVAGLATRVLA